MGMILTPEQIAGYTWNSFCVSYVTRFDELFELNIKYNGSLRQRGIAVQKFQKHAASFPFDYEEPIETVLHYTLDVFPDCLSIYVRYNSINYLYVDGEIAMLESTHSRPLNFRPAQLGSSWRLV